MKMGVFETLVKKIDGLSPALERVAATTPSKTGDFVLALARTALNWVKHRVLKVDASK
jgi:hypothetical protein